MVISHALSALDIKDDPSRTGTPDEYDGEDTRERWSDLDQDQKIDIAVEYMRNYTLRCGVAKAGLLWQEALTESVTTKGMINHIGRLFVRENGNDWVW